MYPKYGWLYQAYRGWDCYYDCPSEEIHHSIGIRFRRVFFGLRWITIKEYKDDGN